MPYTGCHKKVTVYGAIAKYGKQFFRTYDRFDAPTFIEYHQGDAEAFWKASGSSGQGLSAARKICQGIAAGKQEHQDHIPSKRIAVPQCGRRVLAPGKSSSARLRILQDLHGHVQCNLYVLYAEENPEIVGKWIESHKKAEVSVIPDVLTEPRDLAVARAES